MLWAPQIKFHVFGWLTDVSASHSQPWWLPQLHPGFSTWPKICIFRLQMTDRLAPRIKFKSRASHTHGWCHRNHGHICLQPVIQVWCDGLHWKDMCNRAREPSIHSFPCIFATGTVCWVDVLKVSPPPSLTPLNFFTLYWHNLMCFFLDKVVMSLLILTKGRDCICWKLLLECPKALWDNK